MENFGDRRQLERCVYCAGFTGTRDHVPSKVLLDQPYPGELHVVPACDRCNQSFSKDEEYLACLIESVLSGSASPNDVQRENVKGILSKRPALAARLSQARREQAGQTIFEAEMERVRNVVLKLARGHAAYELNEPQFNEPTQVSIVPLAMMTDEQRKQFEDSPASSAWPEVGSRAMQRMVEGYPGGLPGWVVVQEGRYRYLAAIGDGVVVRMILSDYLACEVTWQDS